MSVLRAGRYCVRDGAFGAHTPTLESIKDAVQGKVLVDVTVPLVLRVWRECNYRWRVAPA